MEDTNSGTGNGLESETIFTRVKRKDEKEEEGKEDEEAKNKVGLGAAGNYFFAFAER